MDLEGLKSVFPLLGGMLALAGGVFSFVSGRLKDADGAEAKAAVIRRTWGWVALGLAVAALIATVVLDWSGASMVLFSLSVVVQLWMYLARPGPLHRVEVLLVSVLVASLVTSIAMAVTFSLFERLVKIQRETIQVQDNLLRKLQSPPAK
ncbi:MAG TPA: hypothetical protein VIL30_15500 [Ramlibacter sp.]|jgi:hypothetical protein